MEKWESYFHQPKPIKELIQNALIVVDTNVLLSAYQWRDLTVKEMVKTLEDLAEKGRLRIPFQVLKEFSNNRPKEIVKRINEIESILSTLQPQKPLNQIVPILEGKQNYQETSIILDDYNNKLKEYRKGLIKLRDDLKHLFIEDPYLEELKAIMDRSLYQTPDSKSVEELTRDAEKRFKSKIPPGYKDDSKVENNAGDYIVWDSMLSLKSDLIFISGDKKTDWVYTDKQKNPISARRELIEEFYIATDGKDFAHLTPKEFITLINPDVSNAIKTDLSINIIRNDDFDFMKDHRVIEIFNIFYKYDSLGLTLEDPEEHTYLSITREILKWAEQNPLDLDELDDLIFFYYNYESVITTEFIDLVEEIKAVLLNDF